MIDWLLGTIAATSGLILLVLLVREPVRKRFGSRIAYGLWLIPAARLFMPTLTHIVERRVAPQPAYRPLVSLGSEPVVMAHVTAPSLLDRVGGWPTILLTLWLGVAAGLFVSRLMAFRRDRAAMLRSSVQLARLGSVRIVRTAEVESPVALGILDRIIAVPSDFDRRYADSERRLVLEHELSHHRSGDLVANLFAFVLLCLQWFNPLAWVAHAAFRFDQEAACDARVLDKVKAVDRANYGRAIAKAASGRALLFASALDRPKSLQRRLQSMLRTANPARRLAGRAMILAATAVALPLTASHAIEYVDVHVPEVLPLPSAHTAAVTSATPAVTATPATPVVPAVAAAAAVQATPATPPVPRTRGSASYSDGDLTIHDDLITIDGRTKRYEELTPAEKARVRSAVATARAALDNTHFDRAKVMRDVAAATRKIDFDELQRHLAQSQAGAAEAMRGLDSSAAYLRAAGQDPEKLKATVREALESVRGIDMQAIKRAMNEIDQRKLAETMAGAEKSIARAKVDLDRLDARIRADEQH